MSQTFWWTGVVDKEVVVVVANSERCSSGVNDSAVPAFGRSSKRVALLQRGPDCPMGA